MDVYGMGAAIADFDNDGWQDLHVTNGMVRDFANTDLIARLRRASSR